MRDICRSWYFPSNDVIAKIILYDLYLLFGGKKYICYISKTLSASVEICGVFCRFCHLPPNGVIEKIAIHDLDLF